MKTVEKESDRFLSPTKVCFEYKKLRDKEIFWLRIVSNFRRMFLVFYVFWLILFVSEFDFFLFKGGIFITIFLGTLWCFCFFLMYLVRRYYLLRKKTFYRKMIEVVSQHVGRFPIRLDMYSKEDHESLLLIRAYIHELYTQYPGWTAA